MAGEIFDWMFFEEPLDQFGFIASAKIPMRDEQDTACFSRWKSEGVGEVGVTGNEEAPFGKGKDSFIMHPALRVLGDGGDFVP
jgi:hypothetical protein